MVNNFEKYYKEYSTKVLHYVRSKIHNEDDVQDICAAVFEKVYQHVNSYTEEKASPSTWIYIIAHNSVIDFYRGHRIHSELNEEIAADDETGSDFFKQENLSLLAAALKKLSQKERQIIVFHYYQGLTLKETADKTGMSYSNTKLLHTNALIKRRNFMQPIEGAEI